MMSLFVVYQLHRQWRAQSSPAIRPTYPVLFRKLCPDVLASMSAELRANGAMFKRYPQKDIGLKIDTSCAAGLPGQWVSRDVPYGSLTDIRARICDVLFTPKKQTSRASSLRSAKCQKRPFFRWAIPPLLPEYILQHLIGGRLCGRFLLPPNFRSGRLPWRLARLGFRRTGSGSSVMSSRESERLSSMRTGRHCEAPTEYDRPPISFSLSVPIT